jgi:hypothetical protein
VLVGELVNKETALDDIVDDYMTNGTKLVQDLEDKSSADRRKLESQFSNTLQQITCKFQQTRDAANAMSLERPQFSKLEQGWRKRQHELQDLLKEKVKGKQLSK